ncbi:MAG: hypothetical protein ACRC0B_03580 [Legionella sp.]
MRYIFVMLLSIVLTAQALAQTIDAQNKDDAFALIINSLESCYNNSTLTATPLAKCVLGKLRSHINPDEYRVNFYQESFDRNVAGEIYLTIYNKYGQVFMCNGVAQKTIKINAGLRK